MLPYKYNPENYGGKVWWNEENPEMREKWELKKNTTNLRQMAVLG